MDIITTTVQAAIWNATVSSSHEVNSTVDPDEIKGRSTLSKVLLPAIMFFVGVFGNVLALIILHIRPSKDSRSTAFYHLVKALAVVDLTGIVALSPVPLLTQGQIIKTGGMALCHYFSFAILLAGNCTLSIVIVMTMERFMVNRFPFQYQKWVTRRRLNTAIALLWSTSALLAALPIIGVSGNAIRWPGTWCFFDFRNNTIGAYFYSIFYATTGILIIVVTSILNTWHIVHLWRARRNRLIQTSVRSQPTPSSQAQGPDTETRMVRFLMAIIIIFTICYSPLQIRVLVNQILNVRGVIPGGSDDRLDVWAIRFASFNQIIDPWIYIISRFTCCTGRRERNPRPSPTRTPRRSSLATISNTSSPKKGFIGRSVDHAKSLLTKAKPLSDNHINDNNIMMIPLNPELSESVITSVNISDQSTNDSSKGNRAVVSMRDSDAMPPRSQDGITNQAMA